MLRQSRQWRGLKLVVQIHITKAAELGCKPLHLSKHYRLYQSRPVCDYGGARERQPCQIRHRSSRAGTAAFTKTTSSRLDQHTLTFRSPIVHQSLGFDNQKWLRHSSVTFLPSPPQLRHGSSTMQTYGHTLPAITPKAESTNSGRRHSYSQRLCRHLPR